MDQKYQFSWHYNFAISDLDFYSYNSTIDKNGLILTINNRKSLMGIMVDNQNRKIEKVWEMDFSQEIFRI